MEREVEAKNNNDFKGKPRCLSGEGRHWMAKRKRGKVGFWPAKWEAGGQMLLLC